MTRPVDSGADARAAAAARAAAEAAARRAAEAAARRAAEAAAAKKVVPVQAKTLTKDEMSTGKGAALIRDATTKLAAQGLASAVSQTSGPSLSRPAGGWSSSAVAMADRTKDDLITPTTTKPDSTATAIAAPPIDRSKMSLTDQAVVSTLGLDKMVPGQSTTVEVEANAELAAVLGVEAGATVSVSVERSEENPNEFKITMGGEGELGGVVTGDTAGGEANATAAATANASIELTVDLSKRGAATELVAFAAQVGVMAEVASAVPGVGAAAVALATAIERIPGVNLPGEPVDYVVDHLSAVEVGVGGKLEGVLGGALGPKLEGTLDGYLKGGGRVDFNPDGTLTVTTSISASEEAEVAGGVGAAGAYAQVTLGSQSAEVAFEHSVHLEPGPPTKVLSDGYSASITVGGELGGAGGEAKLTVAMDQLPANIQARVTAALLHGDTQAAAQLISDSVENGSVTASLELSATAGAAGEIGLDAEFGGVGGALTFDGSVQTQIPIASGSVEITADGVKLNVAMLGYPAGTEIPWDQLNKMTRAST